MRSVPDAFYFPQSFIAGCLISFISVVYMTITLFNFVLQLKARVQKAYSNVYDIMFNFFRNGNLQMFQMMKIPRQ